VPQANLANPDPVCGLRPRFAINHGYMVFDTLYGIDDAVMSQPEMCAGHEVSSEFDKYIPRQEKPSYFSGGKVVNFDRLSRRARCSSRPRSAIT
jgi:peptide/nickel transport system substrate-binding protein